jgi:hypothetical protein
MSSSPLLTVGDHSCPCGPSAPRIQYGPRVRFRPVADAFGAPVLRGQGPIGRPGTGKADASLDESDHLLPKPDRALLSPGKMGKGTGRVRHCVVRGCPLGTGQDRCEWQASGTASEAAQYRLAPLAPTLTVG